MMKKPLFYLFFLLVGLRVEAQNERSLFFSEYIANGYTNVLEIFNPTPDTVQLNQFSIVRNGTFRFDFPGGLLLPFDTWVGCRNDVGFPPAAEVLAVADTSWPASGSIWYLSSNAKIELLKNDQVIDVINGDPRNSVVAGVDGALDKHTLIRKSNVIQGETSWDISRGTDTDNSQWHVYNVVYTEIGKHYIDAPNPWLDSTVTISSDIYSIIEDTIYLDHETSADSIKINIKGPEKGAIVLIDIIGNPVNEKEIFSEYFLKVFAEAGNSKTYIIKVKDNPETLIHLESLVYSIWEDSITNISSGTDSNSLLDNVLLFPSGVTVVITDQEGNIKSGSIQTGDHIKAIARDGITVKIFRIQCNAPVSPSQFQVHKVAKVRILPTGAPAYSDVNLTSRWPRTLTIMTGPEALPAAKFFHGTNFRWVYITQSASYNYPRIDDWIRNDIMGNGFRISPSLNPNVPDLPRGGGKAYDSRAETSDGTLTIPFCPNKPMGRQAFINHLITVVEMNIDFSIQVDDPHSYTDIDTVCFCKYCKEKAKEWGMVAGTETFRGKSVSEFWKWVQKEAPKYTGKDIGFSCNNSSNHLFDSVTSQFNFMIGECDPRWGYGPDKYFTDERISAEGVNKMQVYNLSVKGLVIEDPTLLWRNRSMIGLSYGIGGNCIVPWDSWMHPPIEERRYFGKPEEYADLFGFIRANSGLLDGYETAFDYMPGYSDPRYSGGKPVYISENDRAFAFVRAVPHDSSAPVVIHLVDWKESPENQSLTVNIAPEYFFSGKDFGIFLVEPVQYNKSVHKIVMDKADDFLKPGTFRGSEHEAIYEPLRRIQKLVPQRSGSLIKVSMDSIPTYAMLVLVPVTQDINVSSDYYNVNQEASIIKGFSPGDYTCEFLSKLKRSALTSWMVLSEDGTPVLKNITENDRLLLLSPVGRKMGEYTLAEGDVPELEVYFGVQTVGIGSSLTVDPVAMDSSGISNVFTIMNSSSEKFYLDTIISSDNAFSLHYDFNQILPGDSAQFTVLIHPVSKATYHTRIWIRNEDHAVLPFSFNIEGEGLAAGMKVYQGTNLLNAGTGVFSLGSLKIDRDTVVVLSVINDGNVPLNISGVLVDKPEALTVVDFDNQVQPYDSGHIFLKYNPIAASWETMKITIQNNSGRFHEYNLYAEGFGLDLVPQIKVEHKDLPFENYTGVVDFGSVNLNETLISKVVIRNSGPDNLYIYSVIPDMAEFKVVSQPAMVGPGNTDTLVIGFTPVLKLTYNALITTTSNDKTNTYFKFTVKGKGIDAATGLAEREKSNVQVYPNPAISFLNIRVPGNFSLRLLSMKGEIIILKNDCFGECELDINALKGMYIIEICNSNQVYIEKLIVN